MKLEPGKLVVYGLVLLMVASIIVAFFRPASSSDIVFGLSTVIEDAKAGRASRIEVRGNLLEVTLSDGSTYDSRKEEGTSIVTVLRDGGADPSRVEIVVASPGVGNAFGLIIQFLPMLLFVAVMVWAVSRAARRT